MEDRRPVVAILVGPTTSAAVLYGIFDVLQSVGSVYPDMVFGAPGGERLTVRIVSQDGKPFRCPGNVLVEPHDSLDSLQDCDIAIVCDMYSPIHSVPRRDYAVYGPWLRALHAKGVLIGSVCSGSLVLAEAGLVDGREVASHWAYAELFAKEYPACRLHRDSILCLTHEADRIITAGGVTSWQELVLYVIARLCGREAALQTAKVHLLAGHESGQLPFAEMNRHVGTGDAVVLACRRYIDETFTEPNPVQRMVDVSGLNTRTFARRFRSETGTTAIDYVVRLRIEEAKRMLEGSRTPVDDVSWQVGYQDPAAFRRAFRKLVGETPAEYRRRFSLVGMPA